MVTVTTFVVMPLVLRLAVRIGAVVQPDERRVHERPTPLLGGVGMLVGFLVGMAVAWRLHAFGSIFDNNTEPLGLVIAAVLILGVGVIDDLREVSAPAKVSGIVLAASVLVLSGISILSLRIPFVSTFILDSNWSYLVSVIWVLGMTNAINIIDGLDGLAGGIVAIAAAAFFLYAQQLGRGGRPPAGQHRSAHRRAGAGHVPGLPAPQRAPGQDLHGRRRRPPAGVADGRRPPWWWVVAPTRR